mmetsp:Transcript_90472/g.277050  ORF Transcript_90472/g.277050 Transcript_90472/m.277050 type:complete len:574 (+) Transcript_90472:655-2376(+)
MLQALFGEHRASIPLRRDPALLAVLHSPTLYPHHAAVASLRGTLDDLEDLVESQLPNDLALFDVQIVGHGDCADANVKTRQLRERGAGAVFNGDEAQRPVLVCFAPRPEHRLALELPRPFEELEQLAGLHLPHRLCAIGLEGGLHLKGPLSDVVRPVARLHERRALVAAQGDPPLDAVLESFALEPHKASDFVRLRGLREFDDLAKLGFPDGLARLHLKFVRDGDVLHDLEVPLEQREELPLADAACLDVVTQQSCVLGREVQALELRQVRAEGIGRDAVAVLRQLGEEVFGRHAALLGVLPQGRAGGVALGLRDAVASGAHILELSGRAPVGLVRLRQHRGQLFLRVKHRALRRRSELGLPRLDGRPQLLGARVDRGLVGLASLQHSQRRREGGERVLLEALQGQGRLVQGFARRLHGLQFGPRLRQGFLSGQPLLPLQVRPLLRLFLLGEQLFRRGDLALALHDLGVLLRHLRRDLRQLGLRNSQRALGHAGHLPDPCAHLLLQLNGRLLRGLDLGVQVLRELVDRSMLLEVRGALVALQAAPAGHPAVLARQDLDLDADHAGVLVGGRLA